MKTKQAGGPLVSYLQNLASRAKTQRVRAWLFALLAGSEASEDNCGLVVNLRTARQKQPRKPLWAKTKTPHKPVYAKPRKRKKRKQ